MLGGFTIRRDVENLRLISQDNTQWSASQMEIELLRFRLALEQLRNQPSDEALDNMHERFDILWSRVFMMGHGHVGESLLRYDGEHGSVASIADYLKEVDPVLAEVDPKQAATLITAVVCALDLIRSRTRSPAALSARSTRRVYSRSSVWNLDSASSMRSSPCRSSRSKGRTAGSISAR